MDLREPLDLVESEALLVMPVTRVHKDALETKVTKVVRVRKELQVLLASLVQLDRKDSLDLKDLLDNLDQLDGLASLDRPVSRPICGIVGI